MEIDVRPSKKASGTKAAETGIELLRITLDEKDHANIVLATGASQFAMLSHLVDTPDLDWGRVTAFHLDEYIGISENHPASFRRYLKTRFEEKLPQPLADFHYIQGDREPEQECERLNGLIGDRQIDVAFVGIGENGHLAFNDPPADFETEKPFIIVELDEDCRRQQMGEGWFDSIDDVPERAISMSIQQIMKSRNIICTVPDKRKAEAVRRTLEEPISPKIPAAILRNHDRCWLFLDDESASLVHRENIG